MFIILRLLPPLQLVPEYRYTQPGAYTHNTSSELDNGFLQGTSLWECWDLLEVVEKTIPVGIPGQSELNLEFIQDSISFASSE